MTNDERENRELSGQDIPSSAPRYGKKARYAARAGLVIVGLILLLLLFGMFGGFDAGTVAITSLASLIVLPVLLWLMVWSLTRMHARSWEAGQTSPHPAAAQKRDTDTVVFDIGNVLADFSWERWLAESGVSKEVQDRIAQASVKSPLWNEVDRGVWSYEEFVDGIVRNDPALEQEIRTVFARDYHSMITKRERAIPWLQALKEAGYRVYYLSNFSEKAHRECADALGFLEIMDGGILSYRDKVTKPDEKIYRLLIDRYQIDPEKAVFIDDMPANVEAARKEGFQGIVFTSQEQAEADLRALGVSY